MLRGERGFNIAGAPTARFVADSFGFDGDKLATVNGTLTLLGKSQPVTLRAQRFNCYMHPMLKARSLRRRLRGTVSRWLSVSAWWPQAVATTSGCASRSRR